MTRRAPVPHSAGVILTYKCSAACRHCMYACSPEWQADWMSDEDLEVLFSRLADTIQPAPWGADSVGLSSGLHLTGGEPFLNFQRLLQATIIAAAYRLPSLFVETNCSWCTDDQTTRDKLYALQDAGMRGIMISVNPFYTEYIPFERTERAIRISREVFGDNTMVYQLEYYRRFRQLGIRGTVTLEDYIARAGEKNLTSRVEMFLMGKATDALRNFYPSFPARRFLHQPCQPPFLRTWHNHFDNYGNYMPGFCGGISLGDWHDLDLLLTEGMDLTEKPVLHYLVEDDFEGLFDFARHRGYREKETGYVSKCDLCLDIRRHLHDQRNYPELAPDEFYRHI